MFRIALSLGLLGVLLASGCSSSCPADALALDEESMARRQLQTRRFETTDELKILQACAGVIQDLGYSIDEGESEAGLLVASAQRDAVETGQVAGAFLLMLLTKTKHTWDDTQKFRASVVTRPLGNSIVVRVTFQRVVWDNEGKVSRQEGLYEPESYQQFFSKLSKAVFLEAHEI